MSSRMDNSIDRSMDGQLSEHKAKVTCPYCASVDTEFFSLFGQQLLTMQYYCNACHTPFEYVKDELIEDLARVARPGVVAVEEYIEG